jgi:hypothetical protein
MVKNQCSLLLIRRLLPLKLRPGSFLLRFRASSVRLPPWFPKFLHVANGHHSRNPLSKFSLPISVVTSIQAGQRRNCGSLPGRGNETFLYLEASELAVGLFHPASFSLRKRGCFQGRRRLGLEVGHSPAVNAKITIICSCNSTPSHTLMPRIGTFIYSLEAYLNYEHNCNSKAVYQCSV